MMGSTFPDSSSADRQRRPGSEGWIPWALRNTFLYSLACFLLLLVVVIEGLRQYSSRNNGLIRFSVKDDLPTSISITYIYVPTAVGVIAATLWSFCSFDVLRLEPYFQLAKPEGVSATVLFTNYSFCYGILAPLEAVRNRHWIVFCVSSLSLVMRLFLPSLLSGLVVLTDVELVRLKDVSTWPELVDVATQRSWLSTEAVHRDDSVTVTVDDIFLFRSSDYATAAVSTALEEDESATLALEQPVYWAEVSCQGKSLKNLVPITSSLDGLNLWTWNVSGISFSSNGDQNTKFCQVDLALTSLQSQNMDSGQVQYWEPVHSGTLSNTTSAFRTNACESYDLFGILIDVKDIPTGDDNTSNGTAFACSATYHRANAEITMNPVPYITTVKKHPATVHTLDESNFSSVTFRDLVFSKSRSSPNTTFGMPDDEGNSHIVYPSLVTLPDGNHSPSVRASRPRANLHEYQNAIKGFWKKNFIIAIDKFFDPIAIPTAVRATEVADVVALSVTTGTAIIIEVTLLLGVILLVSLAVIYPRRPNLLRNDPGPIIAQCGIVVDWLAPDNILTQAEGMFNGATTRQLRNWAKNFWCRWTGIPGQGRLQIIPLPQSHSHQIFSLPLTRRRRDPKPHFLFLPWFLTEGLLLAAVLLAFCFSLNYIRLSNINHLSKGEQALMTFLMYCPTMVSSMVSTLLASILRHLSVLEPWIHLTRGMATARRSLSMNYGSQSPFSVLWKTWRRGPFLLALLSVVSVLNLLLAIISGGIFEPQVKDYRNPTSALSAQYRSTMFRVPPFDMKFDGYSLISRQLTSGDALPPWADANYSFLPFKVNVPDADDADDDTTYTTITRGIGASLECHQMAYRNIWSDQVPGQVFWNHTTPSGTNCTVEARHGNLTEGDIRRSIRYILPTTESPVTPCHTAIFLLAQWDTINTAPMNSSNTMALYCQPQILIDDYEVQFDSWGGIYSYNPVTPRIVPGDAMLRNASHNLAQFNRAITSFRRKYHHDQHKNFSISLYDWPGMLTALDYHHQSPYTSDIDPFNPTLLINVTESTYQSLFSTYVTLAQPLFFDRYPTSSAPQVSGTVTTSVWGMVPSTWSLSLIISLLAIDISLLILVFVTRYNRFQAPRIPRSIGSLIPWVTQSRMISDFRGTSQLTEHEQQALLEEKNRRYTFGYKICPDGVKRWMLDYGDLPREEDHELEEISAPRLTQEQERHNGREAAE